MEVSLSVSESTFSSEECLGTNLNAGLPPDHDSQDGYHTPARPPLGLFTQTSGPLDTDGGVTLASESRDTSKKHIVRKPRKQKATCGIVADISIPTDALIRMLTQSRVDCQVMRVANGKGGCPTLCEFTGLCDESSVVNFANQDLHYNAKCPEFVADTTTERKGMKAGCQAYCDMDFRGAGQYYPNFSTTPRQIEYPKDSEAQSHPVIPEHLVAGELQLDNLRLVIPESTDGKPALATLQLNASLTADAASLLKALVPMLASLGGCSPQDTPEGFCALNLKTLVSNASSLFATKKFVCGLSRNGSAPPTLQGPPSGLSLSLQDPTDDGSGPQGQWNCMVKTQ